MPPTFRRTQDDDQESWCHLYLSCGDHATHDQRVGGGGARYGFVRLSNAACHSRANVFASATCCGVISFSNASRVFAHFFWFSADACAESLSQDCAWVSVIRFSGRFLETENRLVFPDDAVNLNSVPRTLPSSSRADAA